MPTLELETLSLAVGAHSDHSAMCVMEAVAFVAGEPWSDSPQCASPVISAFLRRWNDDLNDTDRQMLKPYIPQLVGTNTGKADDERRAWLVTDWMVREYLPAWLRTANLNEQADAVAALPELVADESWDAARETVKSAQTKAAAAGDAAGDAARRGRGRRNSRSFGPKRWIGRTPARDAVSTSRSGTARNG